MSESSPGDLAVAFRSFPRRLAEALAALGGDGAARAAAQPHVRTVTEAMADAAALLGAPTAGEPDAVARGVAERITATHPDQWDDVTLAGLRRHGLAAGAALRAIDALAP